MGEEISDTMNLDLNLGPAPETEQQPISNETTNLEWITDSTARVREAAPRLRARQRWRWRPLQIQIPVETQNLSIELNQLITSSADVTALQTGEGSIAAEERINEGTKTCENGLGIFDENVPEKKDNVEKISSSDGSFFDCNICLDLAKEPVVTCCGHLFCWPCIYRWLHLHSEAKECPVCKGEVALKTVTPIYGRGTIRSEAEEDPDVKIPMRPHARRIESLRQALQRSPFTSHMEEVMRRIQSRFDREPELNERDLLLNRLLTYRGPRGEQNQVSAAAAAAAAESSELTQPDLEAETPRFPPLLVRRQLQSPELNERDLLLNRFLTSRGLRGEQNQVSAAAAESSELTQPDLEAEAPRFPPLLVRRQLQSHRAARISSLSSALSSAERLVDAFRSHPLGRNHQEQNPPVDDRDSFSSIAAVINSESQVDTAVEIDSTVTLSTSSSRRRNENTSRVSDVDSADSRAPRRRRLR